MTETYREEQEANVGEAMAQEEETREFDLVDGEIKQTNWVKQDTIDFLSDFAGVTDSNSIHQKSKEIAQEYLDKGYSEQEALCVAEGWERALEDILNQA